ncbi:acetyl-coenzyme A synthetase [Sorangium cellulosum]|uniref:Acetyl-coenzyme A synthetase n=2 Tax=Sorangium cellulosum TaxID=56 RepID=A0A150P7D3_SORCE|nr:acetate--CoA ligase [Sorangium cellulosum]AGP32890.1 3-hydroxypropionyl-CoA synthetase [Sorangium cellulosum So0157-2]KYF51585.1 acetyl-coenzyme A synthetase [Sorangium cellulosum]
MSQDAITSLLKETRRFEPPAEFSRRARVGAQEAYEALYRESIEQPDAFWRREAGDLVFRTPWTTTSDWSLPHAKWFLGATLNVTESCLDRHLTTATKNKAAIIWEGEHGATRTLTYAQLHRETLLLANALKKLGIEKGDRVAIYMGMVPEVAVAMLACARLGAVHTVVFGGFAADALRDRIHDSQAKLVITQDGAYRRGQVVPLKATVDKALAQPEAKSATRVIVYQHLGGERCEVQMTEGRDVFWHDLLAQAAPSCEPTIVDAEHPLFILYTSGSTGKPKGVLHTTAGYLVGVHVTTKYVFDLRDDDVYWCTADVGWVTGHSYIVYGPLSSGATCLMYEGAPNFPDWGRFWRLIEKHGVTILYTAPTAIRAFMRQGDEWPAKSDLSSLRLLGSVGEPINPEAWIWYHRTIGGGRCPVVDTWWQTETGAIMMTTLPGASHSKPGSTGLPMFGVVPEVVTKDGKPVPAGEGGLLVLKNPWPSMLRTVWGDDERFRKQYFSDVEGCYFTGDGARRDEDGYYWVVGRIDDVLNVAGHRIGTAEIESALVSHPAVAEAAAVGRPDELKGQALVVFVSLRPGFAAGPELQAKLAEHVAKEIGKFARPDAIRFADALPKTRSGKIMRRLLKDVAAGREMTGDTSTLEDLSVVAKLRQQEDE